MNKYKTNFPITPPLLCPICGRGIRGSSELEKDMPNLKWMWCDGTCSSPTGYMVVVQYQYFNGEVINVGLVLKSNTEETSFSRIIKNKIKTEHIYFTKTIQEKITTERIVKTLEEFIGLIIVDKKDNIIKLKYPNSALIKYRIYDVIDVTDPITQETFDKLFNEKIY